MIIQYIRDVPSSQIFPLFPYLERDEVKGTEKELQLENKEHQLGKQSTVHQTGKHQLIS